MSRLAFFLTALCLSSAAAHPGFGDFIGKSVNTVTKVVVNEAQAAADPVGQTIAFVGGSVCKGVKQLIGVEYEDYTEGPPDMSKLNIVLITSVKTVIYNLSSAAEEIPKDTWFDQTLPLTIFLHGFTDNPTKSSFQTMRTAYEELEKSKGKVNILALDASSLIKWFYLRATTMVQFIGEKLGATMAAMIPAGLDPKNIHLIGHSLGSHIAGFAGQQFITLTASKVGRISSLDPAGPCFAKLEGSSRLSASDADFVDVIHTDSGVYGLKQSIGHVDFWVNGGAEQPGCLFQTCSHSRAWEYYAESVNNPAAFPTVQCDSNYNFRHGLCNFNDTSIMGYYATNTTRGNYYCITRDEEPFNAGIDGLTYKNNGATRTVFNGIKDLTGKVNILALDASSLIKWFYLRATTMVQFIGEKLGATMAAMIPAGLDPKNIHLIGHSLGSHIAGFAGQQFITLTASKVGRISSLDPAGPCFAKLEGSSRLSASDADFVDVIHTDSGVYGLKQSIGHVDFWVNGGAEQPGCLFQTCSHSRAWEYYAESVNNPAAFPTVQCDSNYNFRHGLCNFNDTSIMGYYATNTTRGNYYCITRDEEPFNAGIDGLTYKNNGATRTVFNGIKDLTG